MSGVKNIVEVIPGKLFWISDRIPPRNQPNSYYFCIDNQLVYQPFCNDFGPLSIGMSYKYCIELQRLINNKQYSKYKIFHYTSLAPHKRANAACLMGIFQILVLRRSAEQAWEPFSRLTPFQHYRDAGYGGCTYQCTILHCLKGLEKGVSLGWFNLSTFNVRNYEFYQRVQNGDWNWIIPGKILALACPSPQIRDNQGFRMWTPQDYCPLFKDLGISAVIRLNNKTYEAERFVRNGIRHYDLFFVDGSCPDQQLILQFVQIVEQEKAVAVHCKAGLGRTGTMIGCFAMKHFGFKAEEFIGWARLMRPGSVLGPQQQFLKEMESRCRAWKSNQTGEKVQVNMSPEERRKKVYGDFNQAERLVNAKRSNQSPFGQGKVRTQSIEPVSSPQRNSFRNQRYNTPGSHRKSFNKRTK